MGFNLFRRKNKPRPIFEPLGTDMHCHLVPKVDDGSKCTEESIECLETLHDVGFKKVIITPHFQYPRFPNDEDDIIRRYEDVKQKAEEAGVKIEIQRIAGEYRIDAGFAKRMENPRFLKLSGNCVLTEFSLHQKMQGCDEMIFDMQLKGYDVILAHPERYPYLGMMDQRMEQLKNQGVYFQCNILSFGGFYGPEAKRRALEMVDRGWVEYLGTDMHNTMYAQALVDLSNSTRMERLLAKHTFLNSKL